MNRFNGNVAFSVSGLPSGVTAEFEPTRSATTYPISIEAADDAAAGPSTINVTGMSGSVSHTASFALNVLPHPDFALGAWSNDIEMAPASTAARRIVIKSLNGFADSVALSTVDVPKGLHAGFSPSITSAGSTSLVMSCDSSVQPGDYQFTAVATSGEISHSWLVPVHVALPAGPDFRLTAWPQSVPIAAGTTGGNMVTIYPANGFSGPVDLAVDGLPAGVTASFSPARTSGMSMLTITASKDAGVGSSIITITGKAQSITRTARMQISISSSTSTAGR